MIKYFAVENFRSIMKENILEFDTNETRQKQLNTSSVIGFVGANASGKTTILDAITFVLWFMKDSFLNIKDEIPIAAFATTPDLPTKFHIIFSKQSNVDDQVKYIDYEYALTLTSETVIYESLHYYTDKQKNMAYIRNAGNVEFGSNIPIPASDIKVFNRDLKHNSSIISYAAMYPSQVIAIDCQQYPFQSNVRLDGFKQFDFNEFVVLDLLKNKSFLDRVLEFLKVADVGIENIMLIDDPLEKKPANKTADILFEHHIGKKKFSFNKTKESSGTLKFVMLLAHVFKYLDDGTLLILDEIELHLHPDLICLIIDLFKTENEHNAQLIFSFHNTALMEMLLPDELWFTEKNDNGDTTIFSALHFEDIQDMNEKSLEKLYRIGRFGAKPRGI